MNDLTSMVVRIATAEDLRATISTALTSLSGLVTAQVACLLLWDQALEHYIIGDLRSGTWPVEDLGNLRRSMLRWGIEAYQRDPLTPRVIAPDVFYQPLQLPDHHIGAFIYRGKTPPVESAGDYAALIEVAARTIFNAIRLDQAAREQAILEAERQRLEHLLRAVEDQQRAIDRLLMVERQLSATLDAKVQERTDALRKAQTQLIQSEKLAVIGQLASSLAHEINNPLQAVQSGLGLVLDELDPTVSSEIRSDLKVILLELERVSTLFRQLLDFYRPASFERVPLDLNAICGSAQSLMRKRLNEGNISLDMQLASRLPLTCGDENQIKQVVLNLMLNAAEAMTRSGGMLWLSTFTEDLDVCIRVADNGPGISPEHQVRLFEPLFTTKAHGLGLGLAISHEIIRQHNGRIKVENIDRGGAAFTICLPIQERCDDASTNSNRG